MKSILLALFSVAALSTAAADRPDIAKGPAEKRIFVHCNPWFPIDVVGRHTAGGPNVPWEHYVGTNSWKPCMDVISSYGVNGIMLEINDCTQEIPVFRELLNGAPEGFQVMMHFGFYRKTPRESVGDMKTSLGPYLNDLRSNPHVFRLNGRPVLFVYCAHVKPLSFYREVFSLIDREICPMTYLFCYSDLWMKSGWDEAKFEALVREYLKDFDGASTYSFSYEGIAVQRQMAAALRRVRADHPGKVFFGGAFTTWTQPFVQAGLEVHLSRDWRASVDLWMGSGMDAIGEQKGSDLIATVNYHSKETWRQQTE